MGLASTRLGSGSCRQVRGLRPCEIQIVRRFAVRWPQMACPGSSLSRLPNLNLC
jgi:hypothetical protein